MHMEHELGKSVFCEEIRNLVRKLVDERRMEYIITQFSSTSVRTDHNTYLIKTKWRSSFSFVVCCFHQGGAFETYEDLVVSVAV